MKYIRFYSIDKPENLVSNNLKNSSIRRLRLKNFFLYFILFGLILSVQTKCVMKEPCRNLKELETSQDPFESKWHNCKYDDEPVRLDDKEAFNDFKKLCPSLYNGDENQALCCSPNQIRILKRDLSAAEAIIGSCASCYFNFRNIWCHMSCDPNQSEFVIPVEYNLRKYSNFTQQLEQYNHFINKQEDENNDESLNEHDLQEDEEDNNHHNENNNDKSMTNNNEYMYTISKLSLYINIEFINAFIDSCKDLKLYGFDALQSFCGVPSKSCTAKSFGHYMGEVVTENPFVIYFKYDEKKDEKTTIRKTFLNENNEKEKIEEEELFIKPVLPKYHLCNESYQYGDYDYGSKCSCKACQASCEIYDEFLIEPKRHFKIGQLDGLSLIMSLIFLIFLALFTKFLYLKKKNKKKNQTQLNNKSLSNTKTNNNNKNNNDSSNSSSFASNMSNQDSKSTTFRNRKYDNERSSSFCRKLFFTFQSKKKDLNKNIYEGEEISKEEDTSEIEIKQNRNRRRLKKQLNRLNFLDKMLYFGEKLERFIELNFTKLGKFCATYPSLVLIIGFLFCILMCLGYVNFKVEKDPINLWSSDSSIARQNKKYFDENFGPFYRITQLIIEPKKETLLEQKFQLDSNKKNYTITSLQKQILNETFYLYKKINKIEAKCIDCIENKNQIVTLNDICFQPLQPENKNCSTQTIFEYWQNDEEKFLETIEQSDNVLFKHIQDCMQNPFETNCLSSLGSPMHPYMIIGSYENEDYLNAGSIVITYVINNHLNDREKILKSMAWEGDVLKLLKNYTSSLINVYYTTERSIEDELERESKADIKIIGISYVMMFLYLTITLGKYSSFNIKIVLMEMKIFLALAGVFLVILSVFSSGGFFTYLGVPATLITLEVIPFLLLAVGVDNVYILVQTYQNDERFPNESIQEQISRIVGRVGPSMLLTGTTQSAAFLISALTPMPGVRAFSLYASLAIIINFLMQITCFVALLTLDARREQSRRVDLFCCIKLESNSYLNGRKSFLHKFFKNYYTPILFNDYVRALVIIIFVGFFLACVAMCDKIKVGLDQKLTMPTDSYQIKYFEALQKHLAVGPPVYFVLKDGYNYTDTDSIRKLCGSSSCETNSLQSLISSASFFPNQTFIAQSSVNWIDDYMEWLSANPSTMSCCYVFKNSDNKFCDYKKLSDESHTLVKNCEYCHVDRVKYDLPSHQSLINYIEHFLNQNPSRDCIKAGHAMYGNAVKLIKDKFNKITRIGPSHFMAYHKVLSTSDDFVNAMISANQISESITKMLNKNSSSELKYEVFPYSIFYVFYEQYLKIWQDATMQLVLTLAAIFICTFILLSFDLYTALIVTGLIAIIIIDMVGIMFLWNIELNAISLVNLVIAIGISVEFCSHIARAFATSNAKTRTERSCEALYKMGPPVFSGVLQSIVGISVLAFAHSQLFQVFYFRMYFSILMLGLTHGLIFLPVLLSYIGSNTKKVSKKGRSTNHLAYYKVAKNNDVELDMIKDELKEENDNNKNRPELINTLSPIQSEHQVPSTSPQFNDDEDDELRDEFLNTSQKHNLKFNSFLTNKMNDRDSPVSKKSVDCLLGDQNSTNENDDSANSNDYDKNTSRNVEETNIDETDSLRIHRNSLANKINNFFKLKKNFSVKSTRSNSNSINIVNKLPGDNNTTTNNNNNNNTNNDFLSNSLNYKLKLDETFEKSIKSRAKSTSDAIN